MRRRFWRVVFRYAAPRTGWGRGAWIVNTPTISKTGANIATYTVSKPVAVSVPAGATWRWRGVR